ncbi:hypothetical protein ONZ43_g5018 [Nemania bipapillata]|uniref:Uncharacterized protein n=1 Tax=Nemania bipapillata TaxID=110536 RepID=A0ACC2IFN5_9PEZI|nr:hypothetical protein ONZ43_g5018 [Nemania bipapillata]
MPSKTGDPPCPLSDSINAATRSVHAKLNKLVISRLRLALPPQADDASQYVAGLLHVTPIYNTFESLWGKVLESPGPPGAPSLDQRHLNDITYDLAETQLDDDPDPRRQLAVSERIRQLLANLYSGGLQRSQALEKDLVSLTCWSSRTLAEQLNDASESPALGDFLAHMRISVEKSPHNLLAYAWVLYMALFSGGRFIRALLENIYPAFWVPASAQRPAPATLANIATTKTQPLSFFRFDTPDDGEDLKREFKKRFCDQEGALTEPERQEIIQEARCIFEYMIRIIDELDDICAKDKDTAESRLLSLRSRDSVIVENERRQHSADMAQKAPARVETKHSLEEGGRGHVKFG